MRRPLTSGDEETLVLKCVELLELAATFSQRARCSDIWGLYPSPWG
jgi:hypothetical protein